MGKIINGKSEEQIYKENVDAHMAENANNVANLQTDKIDKTVVNVSKNLVALSSVQKIVGGYINHDGTIGTGNTVLDTLVYSDLSANDKTIILYDMEVSYYWGNIIYVTDANGVMLCRYEKAAFIALPWVKHTSAYMTISGIVYGLNIIDCAALLSLYPTAKIIKIAYPKGYANVILNTSIKANSDELLVLPSRIYCVNGHEMNVYYENIIQNGRMQTICACDISDLNESERFRDRLIWKPTASVYVNKAISLYKRSMKQADLTAYVDFISVPPTAGSGTKKVLVIGDSKVAYGEVTGALKTLFSGDSITLELLGSRYGNNNTGDTTNRHEGRGGWSSYHYAYIQSYGGLTNPFYNATANPTWGTRFNFTTYMTNQGYTSVDYVFINLGINDFSQTYADVIWQTDAMIASIHAYDPNIKIIIGLSEGVYRPKMEWDSRNTWLIGLNAEKIKKYDRRDSENIYVCPLYLNMDLYKDYALTDVPLSARDTVNTRQYTSDGIHQNTVGFNKNADTMYYTIKGINWWH